MVKATSSPSVTPAGASVPAVTAGGAMDSTYQATYTAVYGSTSATSAPLTAAAVSSSPGVS